MKSRALVLLFALVVLHALAAPLVAYADGGGPAGGQTETHRRAQGPPKAGPGRL